LQVFFSQNIALTSGVYSDDNFFSSPFSGMNWVWIVGKAYGKYLEGEINTSVISSGYCEVFARFVA